jgi:hypothetical protein
VTDLPPTRQRVIFASLVSCEDDGMTPDQARQTLSLEYAISIQAIQEIATLGITQGWPPL